MTDETSVQSRPTRVTVVSWILILMGAVSLGGAGVYAQQPPDQSSRCGAHGLRVRSPVPRTYAMSFGRLFVSIASGAVLYLGDNWVRFLYVAGMAEDSSCSFFLGGNAHDPQRVGLPSSCAAALPAQGEPILRFVEGLDSQMKSFSVICYIT